MNTMNTLLHLILERDFFFHELNITDLKDYVNYKTYMEEIQVEILSFKIMDEIISVFSKDNIQVLLKNSNVTVDIFILGTVSYSIILVIAISYVYYNMLVHFNILRKALVTLPYKRISNDNNMIMLLKNILTLKV